MSPPLVLHLHAHLPECRPARPGGVDFEDWFFEALRGSYLRLLSIFEGWAEDGLGARLSLSVSAPLLSMLEDEALLDRARQRWRRSAAFARSLTLPLELTEFLAQGFERAVEQSTDVVGRLRRLEGEVLDLVATGASHALLPFARAVDRRWVDAQLGIGQARLRRAGLAPVGFWLPECGADGETGQHLGAHRVPFSFLEGAPGPEGSPFQAPEGTAFFPRSLSVATEIWDPGEGCPGAAPYREFHRDLASSSAPEALERFGLPADGRPLDLKIWSIDGAFHSMERALHQAAADAARFWSRRRQEGVPAVAPFDAELFGHWWYEGPLFLDRLARDPAAGRIVSAADLLRDGVPLPVRAPRPGTWGQHGFGRTWLGPDNAWIQDRIMAASRRFFELQDLEEARRRLPHMLGLMASDWPFILRAGAYLDAIPRRIQDHLEAVMGPEPTPPLHSGQRCEPGDLAWLGLVEEASNP